jgi:hypothetical protein
VEEVEAEAEAEKQHTIGTMLVQLGIPKETLGWNDEEEQFDDD